MAGHLASATTSCLPSSTIWASATSSGSADPEWAILAPFLPPPCARGRKRHALVTGAPVLNGDFRWAKGVQVLRVTQRSTARLGGEQPFRFRVKAMNTGHSLYRRDGPREPINSGRVGPPALDSRPCPRPHSLRNRSDRVA